MSVKNVALQGRLRERAEAISAETGLSFASLVRFALIETINAYEAGERWAVVVDGEIRGMVWATRGQAENFAESIGLPCDQVQRVSAHAG